MKKIYMGLIALFAVVITQAQNSVVVDASAPIIGFANVFETPANGGGFVFGGPWAVPDLKSVVDPGANTITLQPNFNTWNPTDPFWVDPVTGLGNKVFESNTYVEDNSLIGSELTFSGNVASNTIDPGFQVIAFIKVFNFNFSVLKQVDVPLVAGEDFSVTYIDVEPEDTFLQYGFQVVGVVQDPANEAALGSVVVTAPLVNDTCAAALPIACGETLSGDTSNNNDTGGANASPDEWFSFTGTGSPEIVTVSLCSGTSYDSFLSVYDACGGAQIASNDDSCGLQSELSFLSDGTTTYYIAVEGFGTNSGAFDIAVTCVAPPSNDECAGALPLECGVPAFGSTATASADTSPDCTGPGTTIGVWYVYQDTTGLITDININTCSASTDYDTQISVYTGDCGALTCVTGNDDSPNCTNFQSEVDFQSDGNTTFYILVHGFGSATGNFELNMTCTPVPPPNDMIANSIDVDELGIPYTDPAVAMPAATLENGNPTGCVIDGANGVWYNFTAAGSGTANAEIVSPAGASYVVFFKAPDENATEADLEYFLQIGNQCAPGTSANIFTEAGQTYYVFVVNTEGITDIVIDGELLSTAENTIEGFDFYPNPTDGTLNLSSVDNIEDVSIFNLLGQEVLGQQVEGTNAQLDVSSLATGAYIMKVTVNGEVGTYKVVKQ